VSSRWLSPRTLLISLGLLVWVLGCSLAAWWQVGRAFQGNQYSYLYAIEWPALALVGVFAWWRLVRADPAQRAARARERALAESARARSQVALRDRDAEDEALAAYNDHLARLAASDSHRAGGR